MKTDRKALARRVAEAVLDVPGVACLRPGLRGLLHTAAGTRPPAARLPDDPGTAVRITFDARGRAASLHVDGGLSGAGRVHRGRRQLRRAGGDVPGARREIG
ncbi:hypothetical protein ABT331_39380, partial [Streptomyces sp. NPDC000659]|uniref:hypothetical protein n=1 Tax=Streptomyces sp. NPDC000659 TaxID=3154367 RepID=UPI003325F2CC